MKTYALLTSSLILVCVACAAPPADRSDERTGTQRQAMMDDDGIDCSNCLGGECVDLHCFEDWTHSGGGGGPYTGGGGGGGYGGGSSSGSSGTSSSGGTPPPEPGCGLHCARVFTDCLGAFEHAGWEVEDFWDRCRYREDACYETCPPVQDPTPVYPEPEKETKPAPKPAPAPAPKPATKP